MSKQVLRCKKCGEEMVKAKGRELWYCPQNLKDPKHQSFWQPKGEKPSHREIMNYLEKIYKKLKKIEKKLSTTK